MSQNNRNQPDNNNEHYGRNNNSNDISRYQGFEGMNYEQERQSYNYVNSSSKGNEENMNGNPRQSN